MGAPFEGSPFGLHRHKHVDVEEAEDNDRCDHHPEGG